MPSEFSKIPHKTVNQGGQGGPTGGAGNPGDNSNPDGPFLFDMGASHSNQCQDKTISQPNPQKKKKRRNSHLDREVEINGHKFEIERAQIEKKTPRHGVDLGLEPDIGADGKPILDKRTQKPMAKGNKENYELFADNLEKFMENSEMREGYFRKGRENQQETFNFYDAETNRVASFRKDNGKFISFWKMDKPGQIDEFLNNNNVI